jgi:hypothetical protein
MSEATSTRPSLWFAVAAVLVAAAVWATVAMAAGGSSSNGTSTGSPAATYDGPHAMFAASGGSQSQGDCPNMGNDGGSGGSPTAPSTTPSTTTPSTQDGSSNSGL